MPVSLPRSESGYWEEGLLAAFIPQSAVTTSWGAPETPQGSHERLLLHEKQEQIQSCGTGLVKLGPWESLQVQHPTSSGPGV